MSNKSTLKTKVASIPNEIKNAKDCYIQTTRNGIIVTSCISKKIWYKHFRMIFISYIGTVVSIFKLHTMRKKLNFFHFNHKYNWQLQFIINVGQRFSEQRKKAPIFILLHKTLEKVCWALVMLHERCCKVSIKSWKLWSSEKANLEIAKRLTENIICDGCIPRYAFNETSILISPRINDSNKNCTLIWSHLRFTPEFGQISLEFLNNFYIRLQNIVKSHWM